MSIETSIVPLRDVINNEDSADEVLSSFMKDINDSIHDFVCINSQYHEDFLKNKARDHDINDMSRTYLILNKELARQSINKEIEQNLIPRLVAGFFTIGISSLVIDSLELSNNSRRKIAFRHFQRDGSIGCFVIGELCRSTSYSIEELPGKDILNLCLDAIEDAQRLVGGRLVLVESRETVLRKLYEPAGFEEIATTCNETQDGVPLITSLRKIYTH